MKVTFKKDVELSYDGVNSKVYNKNEQYTSSHAQEKRVFEHMVTAGLAEPVVENNGTKVETKVTKPKSTKSKK